ncbi:YbaB/EbfC family nucleoid-associated protein [Catenuloplanes atrovinosus]|uniref:DNA-binding YbaB/EbfC family protein n=1 Tax=Catenuloplanes atrovinosus TaxID=137266 RepID=A0AAE4C8W8_9ACTN|nr:YbaB/EbfC family nucleoid-associated protein [Catenuloplanes atrovinosus]MDR7274229.1 DNA-binding YbaB/EbfC family protein [Catenuloplanes atrovinosus]
MQSFDLEQFAARTRAMAEQMAQMQSRLASMTMTGEAGDGLVTVALGANGRVSEVSIDPSLLDPSRRGLLEGLVAEAFTRASGSLQRVAEEHLRPMTDQIGAVTGIRPETLDRP